MPSNSIIIFSIDSTTGMGIFFQSPGLTVSRKSDLKLSFSPKTKLAGP